MTTQAIHRKVFVTGATGFIGTAVVYALLEAGAQVTALIPPDGTLRLPADTPRLRVVEGDVWNRGSLTKRSRGHSAVIHAVGSVRQDPVNGQSYHRLNVTSLHNVTRMAISDGVPHLVFLSAARAPWLPQEYLHSKQEGEYALQRSGIRWTIVRAPLAYPHGYMKNPLLLGFTMLSSIPLLGWPLTRWAPLPVDTLARGIAQIATSGEPVNRTVYGRLLRKLARQATPTPAQPADPVFVTANNRPTRPIRPRRRQNDDETPFGWLP